MLNKLDEIIAHAKGKSGVVAVAAAHDEVVLQAAADARRVGIAAPILIGHVDEISRMLEQIGEDANDYEIIGADTDRACAETAVQIVREGRASLLMKGLLQTADLMRAVLSKEDGLRTQRLISHCMLYELSAYPRMLLLTDGGVNTFPDLAQKADILENAAALLKALGYEKINAACVCGAETVNSKIPATVDADALAKMASRWQSYHMSVYGPVGLDLALSKEACVHKGYAAEGAGEADILMVPDYQVGNAIGKSATYFGGAKNAGVILGARVPVVLVSRSDSAYSKLASIALGCVLSSRMDAAGV